jgi:hypothetical protein
MDRVTMRGVAATRVLEWILANGWRSGASMALLAACLLWAACTDSTAPAAPAKLAFAIQPGATTAGVPMAPVVVVAIEDAAGNRVTSETRNVTLVIEAGAGGGTVGGPMTVSAVDGVAAFSNLRITRAGTGYTLKAMATGLAAAESVPFDITPGPATALLFTTQPGNGPAGAVITPAVVIAAQDSIGNRTPTLEDTVKVALAGTWPAGTLSGTTAVMPVNGVAIFSDLSVALGRTGYYQLVASSQALKTAVSAQFTIAPPPPPTATLHVSTVTGGSFLDPDGFSVCVDKDPSAGVCKLDSPIGLNNTLKITVDTGVHSVLLAGVAPNCTIGGNNPQTVHATTGDTVAVSFAVTCRGLTLTLAAVTTGTSFNPGGSYQACVDPDYYYYYGCTTYPLGVNGSVNLAISAGSHVVLLNAIPRNCVVSGENPRSVLVSADTQVTFTVTCATPGSVRVTTATSGTDLDLNGYSACIDTATIPCLRYGQIAANGVVVLDSIPAGSYAVRLAELTPNCAVVGEASRGVTVAAGATADVSFDVQCLAAERIAFSNAGVIVVARADGVSVLPLTPGSAPAWSPDGARVAYECGQDICVINADGTGMNRLTLDAAGNRHPAWSPDGARIAFAATHTGVAELYIMGEDGSGVVQLTQSVGFQGSPAWSPDGTKIAFDCQVAAGNDDICVVDNDGTGFTRLTTDPARDNGAAWKPDGSALAFSTARYGDYEIVLMSPAGGSVTRLGTGLAGIAPTWSPDGTRLAFVMNYYDYYGDSYDFIMVAGTDGSNALSLGLGDQPAWKPHP